MYEDSLHDMTIVVMDKEKDNFQKNACLHTLMFYHVHYNNQPKSIHGVKYLIIISHGLRRSLSEQQRNMTVGMLQVGMSSRPVAERFGVSSSITSRLFQRYNATNMVRDRLRSGRPK
ncbi:hypothetical protein KUTeg_020057 [Tegillarca granosa]|uniref:Uncharacterized protein n=1 Tax=Tegillarca granosa TaxID=220873 RepID=A0ABQ9E7E0_TEGGR|nr:hypothetical protein KUTeg_020057 [Tegillarca granosa]